MSPDSLNDGDNGGWGHGFVPPKSKDFEVDICNWAAIIVFIKLQTQWHHVSSMSGIYKTGLIYSSVISVIKSSVKKTKREKVFDQVRIMELEALDYYAKQREREEQQGKK